MSDNSANSSSQEIYLFINGEQKGPFSRSDVKNMKLELDTMIKEGDGSWQFISDILWLAEDSASEALGDIEQSDSFEKIITPSENEQYFTCPHCLEKYPLSKIKYISVHPDLVGDPVLGTDAQKRFVPLKFNAQGYAIDEKGMVCQEMACPGCHLKIPEACCQLPGNTFSIAGAPGSGKSYYLTSMVWQLRKVLSRYFDLSLSDTDETFNTVLNEYEFLLFLSRSRDVTVSLPKTELQGGNYSNQVLMNGMSVDLPLPFIFTLIPTPANQRLGAEHMRNIVLYDNAGEHFEPGRDNVTNQSAKHLVFAESITFLYDPLKDVRMLPFCDQSDPQLSMNNTARNQLVLLNEMINRIRKYLGMGVRDTFDKPLIVVVPKYDAWRKRFAFNLEETPYLYYSERRMEYSLNIANITAVSYLLREMIYEISPEVVTTCESFFKTVYFVPVSALGCIPEKDKNNVIGIKPQNIKPIWAEVPMLLQFWLSGLIDGVNMLEADTAADLQDYKVTDNALIYTMPGSNSRETVPLNYCGYTVYSRKLDNWINFPAWQAPADDEASKTPTDDDFWNNL